MEDNAVGWTKAFYTQHRRRWGASGVLPHHRKRAESVNRLCGGGSKRILELGAGAGGTAAALADLGHRVTAVDIAPPSVAFARELALQPRAGMLHVVEGDFFTTTFEGVFDVVAYWNGFGTGTDADQKRLLNRMVLEWLAPGGCVLLDVFNPVPWRQIAGQEKRVETEAGVFINRNDYDLTAERFLDTWIPEETSDGDGETQSIRCYSLGDFLLLLSDLPLRVRYAEANEMPFSLQNSTAETVQAIQEAWEYLVQLDPVSP